MFLRRGNQSRKGNMNTQQLIAAVQTDLASQSNLSQHDIEQKVRSHAQQYGVTDESVINEAISQCQSKFAQNSNPNRTDASSNSASNV